MINIAIASKFGDDRKTITALLAKQEDFRIISIGEDSYDALLSAITNHPDIIIMDFSMEGVDGSELASLIRRKSPSTALIVLCSHVELSFITKALKAGISGCLIRHEGYDNLASSVRSVFYGGLYISQSARDLALNHFIAAEAALPEADLVRYPLSPTVQGILYGITRGHTDREIAKNLNINIGSLRNCVNKIKKKTGLRNRAQIIIFALHAGIITIEQIRNFFL